MQALAIMYYLWSTGDTSQTIYASNAGSYSVTVGNGTLVSNDFAMFFDNDDSGVDFGNSANFDLEDTTTICFLGKRFLQSFTSEDPFLYKGNCSSSYCTVCTYLFNR